MTAFGPYKYTETINFTELNQNRLFVISGNTGAGKTTIFDGICFALYGTASGQDREATTMLRSDFADDDIHTAVELTFQLHRKTYRILRQLGHVKKGNKTKTGDRYELFEVAGGREIPAVDRQIVSEIDRKIEEMIGLTKDQFKQIVMLPQGEFRKLLTSETENKEMILRRLFKTEPYKLIGDRLKRKKVELEEKFIQEEHQLNQYVQSIYESFPERENSLLTHLIEQEYVNTYQWLEGLEEEITYYTNQIVLDRKAYEEAYEAHDNMLQVYYNQKKVNEQFQALEHKINKRNELLEQASFYSQKEKQLERAEKASQIEPYEKQVQTIREEELAKKEQYEFVNMQLNKVRKELNEATKTYEKEKERQAERDAVDKNLQQLQDFLPVVQKMDEEKKRLHVLKEKTFISKRKIVEKREQLKVIEEAFGKEEKQIKVLDKKVEKLLDQKQMLSDIHEKLTVLKKLLNEQKRKNDLENQLNQRKTEFEKLKKDFTQMERLWLDNHAAILAAHLHHGEACPVCGSNHHPNKAKVVNDAITKEKLESIKLQLDDKEVIYRNTLADYNVCKLQLTNLQHDLTEHNILEDEAINIMDQLINKELKLKKEIEQVEQDRKLLIQLKHSYEKHIEKYKTLIQEISNLENEYQNHLTSYKTKDAVYNERVRLIPEEVRSLSTLNHRIQQLKLQKETLFHAWESAQSELQKTKEKQARISSDFHHVTNQLEEYKLKRVELEKQFHIMLEKARFQSEEPYIKAKLTTKERQLLKEKIETYKQTVLTTTEQMKELEKQLKNKNKKDLIELEKQLAYYKQSYEEKLKNVHATKDLLNEATRLKSNMEQTKKRAENYEKQVLLYTELYDTIRGQNNKKISFERYLQMEYLEQIIVAANQRLTKLSNGQFLLMRSDRKETHGRQSGLALDVYDAYTGLTRDVKTLSGGEKFNASLCLALGMSDVIQTFQGNITIDTMFIDEGFGSLDEETLNKSIETLIELQHSGRMIGVISHVNELKALFPAVLEVTKTKQGYSKTRFHIK